MTNTYYTYEIPTAEDGFEQVTRYYESAEAMSMLAVVARIFCFSDCTDERVLDIQVQGRKVRYCGWQPGMVYRFVFADNGELAGEFCFPQWDH